MIKKIIFILSILMYSIAFGDSNATTWKFTPSGAENNLMIIYKVLPFASFSIEQPETMRVAANTNSPFMYSKSTPHGEPLKVTSNVEFRDEISSNELNRSIAEILYSFVTYSFKDDGKFELEQLNVPEGEKVVKIPGQAYFTDQHGNGRDTEKKCNFKGSLASGGKLTAEETYIDVEFTPQDSIPMGTYQGTLTVIATYEGRDPLPIN